MSKMEMISLIKESLGSSDALHVVDAIAGSRVARLDRKIYYPYFWFSAECSAPTLFGNKPVSASCLIDGCSGIGATSDQFIVGESSVAAAAVLNRKTSENEAKRAAHGFLTHNLGRRLRTIGHFNVELEPLGLVHKAFWLVRCGGTVVMVDSLTGCLHTLGERAA